MALFTIGLSRGLVSDEHPLCFGYADPLLNEVAKEFVHADVICVLGKRMDYRLGFGWTSNEVTFGSLLLMTLKYAPIVRA